MKGNMSGVGNNDSASVRNEMKKQGNQRNHFSRDVMLGSDLWTDGLICAFEFVRGHRKTQLAQDAAKKQVSSSQIYNCVPLNVNGKNYCKSSSQLESGIGDSDMVNEHTDSNGFHSGCYRGKEDFPRSYWIPIGWARISELVQKVQVDAGWTLQPINFSDDDDITVADMAAPYWERSVGPTWWCHVTAGHPYINAWLSNAQWLHPAISIALRDESRLISERMKHLLYEVPVRVAGGILFELLGQSAGDPFVDEDDIPIVLRSWQAQNFLVTALHVKGSASNINVLGIAEVQELLAAGGTNIPRTAHGLIAHLACRLARWDDRLFRKCIFGAADEIELKFMDRRNHEDMHLFSVILNQEIRRLSTQVIRVKWSLHAREEIVFELLQHLRGNTTRGLLEGMRKSTREMIQEQEAVRGRLFTIQDVMQSTVRAWLQDRSLTVTHNLGVFGGCGLVLSIITGLFGINVDGIPGADGAPHAFLLFSGILFLLGIVLIAIGLLYLGLKNPIIEEDVQIRKLELQELVRMFHQEAESHAQLKKTVPRSNMTPTAADILPNGADYVLIS
ncbi:Magnesium transporter CorA family protein [Fagus crenata]